MLNEEERQIIINNSNPTNLDKIKVVIKYIYDIKKVELDINNINLPQDQGRQLILDIMYEQVRQY